MSRAAIYTRISKNNPKVPKVEDQEAQCRTLAQAHGHEVVDGAVYVDDGITASAFEDRPGWAQLLADVQAGKFDVLVAQSEDRFTRQPLEKEVLMLACAGSGVVWLTAHEGLTDPASADGAFMATLRGGMARSESMKKARRQRDANDALAAKGLPLPGGPRPFGYMDDKTTPHPVEAPMIVAAYADLISGKRTLSRIRTDWNAAGVTTVSGKPWDLPKVEKVLRRCRNAGYVQHRGTYDPSIRGQWEPIVSEETYAAALAILNNPKRRLSKVTEAKHLCSSIAKCGTCGTSLRVAGKSKGGGHVVYRCGVHDGAAHKVPGMRHVSIPCGELDKIVTDAVVSAVFIAPTDSVPDADTAALNGLHGRLSGIREAEADLLELVGTGAFKASEIAAKKRELTQEAEEVEAQVAAIAQRNARAALLADAQSYLVAQESGRHKVSLTKAAEVRALTRERFEALTLDQRRALVRGLVEVTVTRGRDPKRVKVRHLVATSLNEESEDVA